MTISTRRIEWRARAAFTLAEVMIAGSLSTIVLAGVLSAFLMLGRTAYNVSSYSEMDASIRKSLEVFGRDARRASDVEWISAQMLTLTLPGDGLVTYGYDATPGSPTYRAFYRMSGDRSSLSGKLVLAREVATDFAFQRFKLAQPGVADNTAANNLETKQIRIRIRAERTGVTVVTATQSAVSASFILRNKRTGN